VVNAQEKFSRLRNICLTKNDTPYSMEELQNARIKYLNNISQLTHIEKKLLKLYKLFLVIIIGCSSAYIEIQKHLFQHI
jgi:hypothetical protein